MIIFMRDEFTSEHIGYPLITEFLALEDEHIQESRMQHMQRLNQEEMGTRIRYTKIAPSTMELYKQIIGAFKQVDWVSLSVRGVYYRIVSLYGLSKTESTYKKVQKAITSMR
ncbi:MAG: hypothetical protein DRJ64_09755, partial [Thermoprotei archaeon]